jgi:type III secretory pathway component EscU
MKSYFKVILSILILFILTSSGEVSAQCAMCKAAQNSAGISPRGLNTGILYLMIIPYIAFSVLGYFWYKASKKQQSQGKRI